MNDVNEEFIDFEDLISQIKIEESNFSSEEIINASDLQLSFQNIGQLTFPIAEATAKEMLKYGHAAPFGWRDQTVIDKSIRDCWEIEPSFFTLSKSWDHRLESLLIKIQTKLGLLNGNLKAELYKMLVYEKNQFFHPHQDTEKENNMVATLVVVLPSIHQHGNITIYHHDQKNVYCTDDFSPDKIKCLSFYSDCHHEVAPILSGYRVVLTYNLIFTRKELNLQYPCVAENMSSIEIKIEKWLQNYFAIQNKHTEKFIYLLDHQYTASSISLDLLKGSDFFRVQSLINISNKNNYKIFLALADIHESWACEEKYFSYDSRKKWHNEECDDVHHELQEILEQSAELQCFKNCSSANEKIEIDNMYVNANEMYFTMATDKFRPFSSEFEGWMGNYGNTLDRWYHRAVIVIWPNESDDRIMFENAPTVLIKKMLDSIIFGKDKEDSKKIAFNNLNYIIQNYQTYQLTRLLTSSIEDLFRILLRLEDKDLAAKYLNLFSISSLAEDQAEILCNLAHSFGNNWTEKWFVPFLNLTQNELNFEMLNFCCQYVGQILESEELSKIFTEVLHTKTEKLIDKLKITSVSTLPSDKNQLKVYLPQSYTNILESLISVEHLNKEAASEVLKRIIKSIFEKELPMSGSLLFGIYSKLMKSEMILHSGVVDFQLFAKIIKELLTHELAILKREPNDWSFNINLNDHCQDCKTLNLFLNSKTQLIAHMSIKKERRMHIHRTIEKLELDLSHETIRKGSPQTLELKKLPSIFTNNKSELEEIQGYLEQLL